MNSTAPESTELLITSLRRRLVEAEETLRAITEGEVDALVVRGMSAEEVFTIESSESYRTFMEAMEPGAAALDASDQILYANKTLTRLLGRQLQELQGKPLQSVLDAEAASTIDELLVPAANTSHSREIRLGSGNGERHFIVSATPLRLGTI